MAEPDAISQHEYLSDLLIWCLRSDLTDKKSVRYKYQSKHMTWAHQLKAAIHTVKDSYHSAFYFETQLKTLFSEMQIEIIPGLYCGRLTSKQWMKLVITVAPISAQQIPKSLNNYHQNQTLLSMSSSEIHHSLNGTSFPLTSLPTLFTKGLELYRTQFFNSHNQSQQEIGNVLMRYGLSVTIENPFHRLLLTIGYFLQLRLRLPWKSKDDTNPKTFSDHKQGHDRARWYFMFVFVPLYYQHPTAQGPGPNEATPQQIYKSVVRISPSKLH